jgi:hypothetical protein
MGRFSQNSESGSGQPMAFVGPRDARGVREPLADGFVEALPGTTAGGPAAGMPAAPSTDSGQAEVAPEDSAAMSPGLQLKFPVQYGLGEYVSFMWQHSGYLIRRRRVGWFMTAWLQLKSTFTAALNFVLLRRARRIYEFTLDEHGIIRTCGSGVTLIPWDDVNGIRRYTRGYLLVLQRGTLPLPYRCLDQAQQATMEALAALLRTLRQP